MTLADAIAALKIAFPHALSVTAGTIEGPYNARLSVIGEFWCADYANKFKIAYPLPSDRAFDEVGEDWLQVVVADWHSRFLIPETMRQM